jgi:hypothetical protein
MTDISENLVPTQFKRDYSFLKGIQACKKIKATNQTSHTSQVFASMSACGKFLGINVGLIKVLCDKTGSSRQAKSKVSGDQYTFVYSPDDEPTIDVPYRTRVRQNSYTCEKCQCSIARKSRKSHEQSRKHLAPVGVIIPVITE